MYHDQELVAAPARCKVIGANRASDDLANDFERLIAYGMAKAVIERLEVVNIDPENSDLEQLAFASGELRLNRLGHAAAVQELS